MRELTLQQMELINSFEDYVKDCTGNLCKYPLLDMEVQHFWTSGDKLDFSTPYAMETF